MLRRPPAQDSLTVPEQLGSDRHTNLRTTAAEPEVALATLQVDNSMARVGSPQANAQDPHATNPRRWRIPHIPFPPFLPRPPLASVQVSPVVERSSELPPMAPVSGIALDFSGYATHSTGIGAQAGFLPPFTIHSPRAPQLSSPLSRTAPMWSSDNLSGLGYRNYESRSLQEAPRSNVRGRSTWPVPPPQSVTPATMLPPHGTPSARAHLSEYVYPFEQDQQPSAEAYPSQPPADPSELNSDELRSTDDSGGQNTEALLRRMVEAAMNSSQSVREELQIWGQNWAYYIQSADVSEDYLQDMKQITDDVLRENLLLTHPPPDPEPYVPSPEDPIYTEYLQRNTKRLKDQNQSLRNLNKVLMRDWRRLEESNGKLLQIIRELADCLRAGRFLEEKVQEMLRTAETVLPPPADNAAR